MRPFRVKIVLLHHKKWVFTGLAALLGLVICVACVSARDRKSVGRERVC